MRRIIMLYVYCITSTNYRSVAEHSCTHTKQCLRNVILTQTWRHLNILSGTALVHLFSTPKKRCYISLDARVNNRLSHFTVSAIIILHKDRSKYTVYCGRLIYTTHNNNKINRLRRNPRIVRGSHARRFEA